MAAVGDEFIYVGPPGVVNEGEQERFPGATYRVHRLIPSQVWMLQLPHVKENIDWHGSPDELDDPTLWQPTG